MKVAGTAVKLVIFLVVTGITAVFLGMVLDQSRTITNPLTYRAVFTDASFLTIGSDVRIAGVPVGNVDAVTLQPNDSVLVTFHVQDDPPLPSDVRAAIGYKNLIGDRYLELMQGSGSSSVPLPPGATIPVIRTSPALDIDTLVGGFQPLFRALAPQQINQLSAELIQVFQGESGSVTTLLASVASLTSTLADHGKVIDDLITNLNSVLGTIDQRDSQLSNLIVQLQQLVSGLAADRDPIGQSIVHINDLAASASNLLTQLRPDLAATINRLGVISGTLNSNASTVNSALAALPNAYKTVAGIGVYGDFFNFYLCQVRVKATGPNGDPVYTPWIESQVPRCNGKPVGQ
jgi:phospholipid/cholesterol/gamma-HCH transport system substrate-binding protein